MHYMLPPEDRLVGAQLPRYIRDQLFWVLHAPRQTGKTTVLQSWARETHLDALAYRLEDPAIRRLMDTLITGDSDPSLAEGETFRLCLDLGLVTIEGGSPTVANPIYREVIARHLTYSPQLAIPQPAWQWERDDGSLDMERLLREFQKFWRRHSELWEQKSDYTEAFPHLLLMAFLQRVTNGERGAMDGAVSNVGGVCDSKLQYSNRQGSRFEYEYAAGRGRMDLAVEYHQHWYIIEIKLIRPYDSPEAVLEEGLEQIVFYRDRIDPVAPAYLVIFDRRPQTKKLSRDDRIKWSEHGDVAVAEC
jgi:hypothetical protein